MAGIADTAKLLASLDLDDKNFNAASKRAMGSVTKLETSFDRIGASAKRGLSNAASFVKGFALVGAGAAVGVIGKSIQLASDLNETQSKVGVVFGSSAQAVLDFGKSAATGLGMSENAAEAAAATYGNLFVSMGMAPKKSADMSVALVKLAGDLASFNNLDPSEVLEKLRAGLTGESEPLKTLGVNINEAIIKQKAMDLGLVKTTTGTLPAAIKAQAAYALILEQTKTAQGDFARTSGGLANQQRILKANLENVGAIIGTAVLPKVAELVKRINDLVVANQPAIREFAELLPGAFDAILGIVSEIPFEQIGQSLQIAGAGAKVLFGAFAAMPPWVQTAVITGWGLNKLTGGALGDIVGELGKGLIKGVLGMNAGVVNINAGVVNGGGLGVGGAVGAGELAAGAGGILAPGMAAAVVAVTVPLVMGYLPRLFPGQAQAGAGAGSQPPLTVSTSQGSFTLTSQQHAVMSGLMPSFDRLAYSSGRTQLASEAVAALAERQMREVANHAASEHADLAAIESATTASSAAAVAKLDALHTDLQTQLGVLKTSKDPAAIAASATALVKDILMGAGGVTSNTNMLNQLKNARQFTAPGSADRKAIDAAIASIGTHIKGEEWIRAQVDGARKIVDSNAPTHKKLDTLDSTVENLLRHGDTNAAEMIRQLAAQKDITITINGLKATVTATDVNEGTTTAKRKGRFSTTASSWT